MIWVLGDDLRNESPVSHWVRYTIEFALCNNHERRDKRPRTAIIENIRKSKFQNDLTFEVGLI